MKLPIRFLHVLGHIRPNLYFRTSSEYFPCYTVDMCTDIIVTAEIVHMPVATHALHSICTRHVTKTVLSPGMKFRRLNLVNTLVCFHDSPPTTPLERSSLHHINVTSERFLSCWIAPLISPTTVSTSCTCSKMIYSKEMPHCTHLMEDSPYLITGLPTVSEFEEMLTC